MNCSKNEQFEQFTRYLSRLTCSRGGSGRTARTVSHCPADSSSSRLQQLPLAAPPAAWGGRPHQPPPIAASLQLPLPSSSLLRQPPLAAPSSSLPSPPAATSSSRLRQPPPAATSGSHLRLPLPAAFSSSLGQPPPTASSGSSLPPTVSGSRFRLPSPAFPLPASPGSLLRQPPLAASSGSLLRQQPPAASYGSLLRHTPTAASSGSLLRRPLLESSHLSTPR